MLFLVPNVHAGFCPNVANMLMETWLSILMVSHAVTRQSGNTNDLVRLQKTGSNLCSSEWYLALTCY